VARGSAGESVLHKHLRILDAFDPLHPFLALSEIADAAGLARSSAHRLVGELEREGLLERQQDRTYRLGVRLWEFASRTPGAVGLRELARPWLGAVHTRIRQHTQLGVLAGTDVLFVERMSAPGAVVNATLIGGRIPLPVSSSGIILLAHAGAEVVDEVVSIGWERHTAATVADGHELRTRIARARADGYAVLSGHIHHESRGVAVPVRGADGSVIAALGVVIPNDGTSPAAVVETLAVAATGIARAFVAAAADGPPAAVGVSEKSWTYIASLHARHHPDRGAA
jgi:DNA-binding IclR family transcriptional regulator